MFIMGYTLFLSFTLRILHGVPVIILPLFQSIFIVMFCFIALEEAEDRASGQSKAWQLSYP